MTYEGREYGYPEYCVQPRNESGKIEWELEFCFRNYEFVNMLHRIRKLSIFYISLNLNFDCSILAFS